MKNGVRILIHSRTSCVCSSSVNINDPLQTWSLTLGAHYALRLVLIHMLRARYTHIFESTRFESFDLLAWLKQKLVCVYRSDRELFSYMYVRLEWMKLMRGHKREKSWFCLCLLRLSLSARASIYLLGYDTLLAANHTLPPEFMAGSLMESESKVNK